MSIDVICVILLAFGILKGYQKGLIIAIASFAGFFIGLAAAMKLAATVATRFDPFSKWLPFLSFLLVFVTTAWLVNLLGKVLHRSAETIHIGLLNRIGGMIMYLITSTIILSLFLFFAGRTGLLSSATVLSSSAFRLLEPLGRTLMDGLGNWIPFFRDMFGQLLEFFEGVDRELASP